MDLARKAADSHASWLLVRGSWALCSSKLSTPRSTGISSVVGIVIFGFLFRCPGVTASDVSSESDSARADQCPPTPRHGEGTEQVALVDAHEARLPGPVGGLKGAVASL